MPRGLPVRRFVYVIAFLTAAVPAAVLALLGWVGFSGWKLPAPLLYLLLASWLGVRLVPTIAGERLSSVERTVLRFWGLSAHFTLSAAAALGTIPLIALHAVATRFAWSEQAGRLIGIGLIASIAGCAAALVWAAWKRFEASLTGDAAATE